MNRNQTAIRVCTRAFLAAAAMAAFPLSGLAADDGQAEREARRLENEIRRQDEQARREIQSRERAQAEALRSQEDAIRRMEATQARMKADAEQRTREVEEQARRSAYIPMYPYIPERASSSSNPQDIPQPPGGVSYTPDSGVSTYVAPRDVVSGIIFASHAAGVRVASTDGDAPFGLRDGDVILAIDGRIPADGPHAARILRSYRSGERVKLRLQRDRQTIELDYTAP
jgi:hypothetical protein